MSMRVAPLSWYSPWCHGLQWNITSHTMTPNENTSVSAYSFLLRICSGLAQCGVPATLLSVLRWSWAKVLSQKSVILAHSASSSSTLGLLRSRCTTLFACRYAIPAATSATTRSDVTRSSALPCTCR